jgi:hypothetical protein
MVTSDLTDFDSTTTPKTARADCPEGKRVIGGGGRINGGGGRVVLVRMRPVHTSVQDRYEVTASKDKDSAPPPPWAVQAYAICATPPPGWHLHIVSKTVTDAGQPLQEAIVRCPGLRRVTGAGGQINGGHGQVALATIQPVTEGNRVVGLEDPTGFNGSWSVTAYAVCAVVDTGVVSRRNVGPFDSNSPKGVEVDCLPGSGERVTSGGAELFDISDVALQHPLVLESISPQVFPGGAPGTQFRIIARESRPTSQQWTVIAHSYCAR